VYRFSKSSCYFGKYMSLPLICIETRLKPPHVLQAVVGYVPQEVVLPATSTVTEYLTFHGALRLPQGSQRHRAAAVSRVVELLGLREVEHAMVGDAWVRARASWVTLMARWLPLRACWERKWLWWTHTGAGKTLAFKPHPNATWWRHNNLNNIPYCFDSE
jgi:hypothetical protein